ncbi:2984_t:CDS:2 [Entrophospora sp. SA101]|nr:2984_t:CDS:2 [Entrophospora sp. SA101]
MTSIAPQQVGSLESSNNDGYYISHQNYLGLIRQVDPSLVPDFIFTIVPGLSGSGISFQSTNYPGQYLRHQDYRIKLSGGDGSDLFKQDASFVVVPGDNGGIRFQSVNYPNYFIRHRANNELWIDPKSTDDRYKKDSIYHTTDLSHDHILQGGTTKASWP